MKTIKQLLNQYRFPTKKPKVRTRLHNGWFSDSNKKMFIKNLNESTKLVIEIGSWLGKSSRFILDKAPNSTLICIDTWQGSSEHKKKKRFTTILPVLYETFIVNMWSYKDRVIPIKMKSEKALPIIAQYNLHPDLVYIDGAHEYSCVVNDIDMIMQYFPNTKIVGDDYDRQSVKKAVDDCAKKYNKKIEVILKGAWQYV